MNPEKPLYAWAWEEDTGRTWTTTEWYRASTRSFKGIFNISLIEASLKVLTRWYYVPSRLVLIYPGTSPLCFRGCELEGTMLHIWWTCPCIRTFWQKIFRTVSSLTNKTVSPNPDIALLDHSIPNLHKHAQVLSFFHSFRCENYDRKGPLSLFRASGGKAPGLWPRNKF